MNKFFLVIIAKSILFCSAQVFALDFNREIANQDKHHTLVVKSLSRDKATEIKSLAEEKSSKKGAVKIALIRKGK